MIATEGTEFFCAFCGNHSPNKIPAYPFHFPFIPTTYLCDWHGMLLALALQKIKEIV